MHLGHLGASLLGSRDKRCLLIWRALKWVNMRTIKNPALRAGSDPIPPLQRNIDTGEYYRLVEALGAQGGSQKTLCLTGLPV